MSDGLGVKLETEVFVPADRLVREMDAEDIASFCSEVAKRLDSELAMRAEAANQFSSGLSELGARFLAEAVTCFYMREKREPKR